ncbi:MAG: spermidine synthase [Phycisphaerales bacterium]
MLLVYTAAIFVAAALLFCVQPMLAKMMLPRLGGSPAVWTASMLFFQMGLLVGYSAAHALGSLGGRRPRIAVVTHIVLAAAAVLALPLAVRGGAPDASPALWVLVSLAAAVGAPYVVLSTVSPVLQKWISTTDHKLAADPYPLYAASNAGSLLGLLAYPFVVEPMLSLEQQRQWWSIGYVTLVVLLSLGGALVARRTKPEVRKTDQSAERPTWPRRLAWIGLAAVPSSLMLGATQHLTTDIAAAPLLWVVPLSLYLLTFIIAFGVRRPGLERLVQRLAPIAVVGVVVAMLLHARQPLWAVAGAHVAAFSLAALLCHQRLAALRPHAGRLTEFYLLVALGGVIGGAFNALLAPVIFDRVLEYPIAIALAMLALPGLPKWKAKDTSRAEAPSVQIALGVTIVLVFMAVLVALGALGLQPLSASASLVERAIVSGLPAIVLYVIHTMPLSLALAVGGMLLSATVWKGPAEVVHIERTFFGVHTVERVITAQPDGGEAAFHQLRHGSTAHGIQRLGPGFEQEPLAYYHRMSPIAEVFALIDGQAAPGRFNALDRVALVGLGTGALASYGRRGMSIDAYEIDPSVVSIARNPLYFTFLSESRTDKIEYFVGDGRLLMEQHYGEPYDLIVLDAFSSDAIPVHLLTVEAFEVYLSQ